MADVVVVNKVDSATPEQVDSVIDAVRLVNPHARLVTAASPVTLGHGSPLYGKRVLIVEDGPTITHGEMEFGAGKVAALAGGASVIVDPRAYAVGSIAKLYEQFPHIGSVLPAMGYSDEQLHELEETINATPCDVVVTGTPIDLARLVRADHPIRHATYELQEIGHPTLEEILEPMIRLGQAELVHA
jgi:predicted GTPase